MLVRITEERCPDFITAGRRKRLHEWSERVAVLGAGAWGTALSITLAKKSVPVSLWVYEREIADRITSERRNDVYLPGFAIPGAVAATVSIPDTVRNASAILLVTPSHVARAVLSQLAEEMADNTTIVSCAKGIEDNSLMVMTQVIGQAIGQRAEQRAVALSGPSFAKEVAAGLPTAVVAASTHTESALMVQRLFAGTNLRVYTSDDPLGVQLGGAAKNVLAIAAGISDGLDCGHNARAAIITRGVAELMRIGKCLGAKEQTLAGLAGFGDLVLTCTGDLSRNRTVGLRLGRGEKIAEIVSSMRQVAEGVRTTLALKRLAEQHGVEMPIVEQVYRILYEEESPKTAVTALMGRDAKPEWGSG
jgi:glycerol-3-phosphate dehydrogenase (NAD(P)+)